MDSKMFSDKSLIQDIFLKSISLTVSDDFDVSAVENFDNIAILSHRSIPRVQQNEFVEEGETVRVLRIHCRFAIIWADNSKIKSSARDEPLNEEGIPDIAKLKAEYIADYYVEDDFDFENATSEDQFFIYSDVWPYWRSQLIDTASKAGFPRMDPPATFSALNQVELMLEEKEEAAKAELKRKKTKTRKKVATAKKRSKN
jgi:hypothetical protein